MFEYKATVKRVIDGDTVDAVVDLGFKVAYSCRIRLAGIDTPESRTRDLTEKRYGLGAKHRMQELLDGNAGKFVLKSHGVGKFGRCLGEMIVPVEEVVAGITERTINNILMGEGHAVPYTGGSKKEIKQALLEARTRSKEYVEKHIKPLD
tara:strand:- start:13957 stop:14406 length:450 start_codon:yes stop_codon:yes gene_type:complete